MAESETLVDTARADLERPLRSDVEYFDATPSIEALARHAARQHQQITDLIEIAKKLIAANIEIRKKLIELEGDMIKPEQRSALILPDHMKGN